MRRIVIWIASTVTVVVLLFGYHTSTNRTAAATGSTSVPGAASSTGTSSGSTGSSPPPDEQSSNPSSNPSSDPSSGSSGSSKSSTARKSYTGEAAETEWGPVQVKITVADHKVTAVDVVEYPANNPRDMQINAYALPILVQETISAQSADIDMISGATVTSDGYIQSLQSALDAAGI